MTIVMREPRPSDASIALEQRRFEDIPRADWERLVAATPHATPFSSWTFQRAWWDAFGDTAEERYLVVPADAGDTGDRPPGATAAATHLRAIVPLMERATSEGRVLFMGASYHADYATILADPADLPSTIDALAATLVVDPDAGLAGGIDAIDLRRIRRTDPSGALIEAAFASVLDRERWDVERALEDVCPVLVLATDWESQLGSMARVARHELRRKVRRAERTGPISLRHLPLDATSVERFIDLHQARWGAKGLFADTPDGERSRTFLHRFAELEAAEGPAAQLLIVDITVGERVIAAAVAFDDGTTCFFWNAGMDPAARELSPGVIATAMLIRDRMEAGTRRFDFLRGDEAYKYEWGAADEIIDRVTVRPRV
jgi:CelD/BcsL family acetyltransferase involved in cellulose biosynthesis